MCPHPTNPPREPQPHQLSEWPTSQETAKPPPTTHPKRQPHDQPIPKAAAGPSRSKPWRRTNLPLAHRAKAPSSPEPPQRAQARSCEATTHDPPQAPAPRPTHPQGGSGTEPEQALEANKPLPSRTARKPHPPQSLLSACRLWSREAQTKPPTLQTPSPKETHRLFEKRTSRATNP